MNISFALAKSPRQNCWQLLPISVPRILAPFDPEHQILVSHPFVVQQAYLQHDATQISIRTETYYYLGREKSASWNSGSKNNRKNSLKSVRNCAQTCPS
jgi:phosphoribosyl-AMP cyclohydrolase